MGASGEGLRVGGSVTGASEGAKVDHGWGCKVLKGSRSWTWMGV